ncbi:MAG: PD40 domain-containing protein [Lentisphaeria bacterium]|nr:PD40 domain-containing protein [Lentisphaeria bacterium]
MKPRMGIPAAVGLLLCAVAAAAAESGRIVFCSDRSGAWRIWSIAADGSEPRQLTDQAGEGNDVDPVFSPDGERVLFSSSRGGTAGVWVLTLADSRTRRLCDGDQAEWSPDGTRIAFRRGERIVVRELATGDEYPLTPPDWPHCSGPAWRPDGATIAFAARWDAGNGIYTVAAAGGEPVKVYDRQGACEPHWAPDGTRIVYETETHIHTIRPDGTGNRPVTYFGGVQRYARFSPDGRAVVFCQAPAETGPWELYTIVPGEPPRRLTEGYSDMHPDWWR